MMDVYVSI